MKTCAKCKCEVTQENAGVWCDLPMFGDLPVFCKRCWKEELELAKINKRQGTLDFKEAIA